MATKLTYLGHASIKIMTSDSKVIYIDPFAGEDYRDSADLILVTHAHFDHTALNLIKNRAANCQVITQKEALSGGTHNGFDLGFVLVQAVEAGNNRNHNVKDCVGYVLTFNGGIKAYFSGDTSFVEGMKDLKDIDYAFLCCDGVYNMGLEEAARCAEIIGAKHTVPYHIVATDEGKIFDEERARMFDVKNKLIIRPNETIIL